MTDPSTEPRVLYQGAFLSLRSIGAWEYAARQGSSGVVGILAVSPDQKLLLVEQFRIPVGQNVIELPAGLAGDLAHARGEDFARAAERELLEETGYLASEFELLAVGPSSAGLTDETVALYRASNLRRVSSGGGDESENITVHEIPLADVRTWLAEQVVARRMVDFKVFAGLWFLENREWLK